LLGPAEKSHTGRTNLATKHRTDLPAIAVASELEAISAPESGLPPGISTGWWATVQEEARQAEYQVTWQDQTYLSDLAAAYQAPNRAHNLRTYFTPAGIRVIPRTPTVASGYQGEGKGGGWEWGLTLTGYGYMGHIQPVVPAKLAVTGNRVEYQRGGLTEWYVNDAEGLEQGFTLAVPPQLKNQNSAQGTPLEVGKRAKSNLVLTLALSGNLIPSLMDEGQAVDFITPAGVRVLRYSNLHTYDATGRKLPTRLATQSSASSSGQLTILVDDTAAIYPLTIDPLATPPNWTAESNQANASFGVSVGTAGDVNGDGYDDVIVGASKYDNGQTDEGRVFVYHGSASGLSPTISWQAEINQAGALFGGTVGTAGDVNADGYDDIIVGALLYDNGQTDEGSAFVWYGGDGGLGANGTRTNADWRAESNQTGASFNAVATAGDVNDDGYADIIIGASKYNNGQNDEGRVFVWYGGGSGLGNNGAPGNADWRAESNQAGANFGQAVGTAGDVNGDGFADIIVGADRYDNGQSNEGRVFVWYGGASGLGDNGAPGNADWKAESNQGEARFGISAGTAGDVNEDGYDDIIVGAYFYDKGQSNEGLAFVWHGSSSGLGNNGAPGNADWTTESNQAAANLGWAVGATGDVNSDGYADVIVGAPGYDNGQANEGRAFVYHGSASGLSLTADWTAESDQASASFGIAIGALGDVNGDSYSDVIIGASGYSNGQAAEGRAFVYHGSPSGPSPAADWTAESDQTQAFFNRAATAGDVNGDGYADVIIGAYGYDNGQADEGRAFVYHGSASGLSLTADWTAESDQESAFFGIAIGTAGDVNGDDYADVIIGAPGYDNGQMEEGRAFVYYGSATGLSPVANWTSEGEQANAGFGSPVGTAGDVNGDGYADIIIGASGYDNDQTDEGRAFVWYGSNSGLGVNANWTAESNQAEAFFGSSASTAGDVNGDGYADIIVGARLYDNGQINEGGVFVYHGSAAGLSLTANWTAESDQADAAGTTDFGSSAATAGDVNGDGYADVIVGAVGYDNGQVDEGQAFVYHGSTAGLNSTANWTAESNQMGSGFAISVATAGDVNGDGYGDVIVGALLYGLSQPGEGRAFIWYGGSAGLGANGDPTNADWLAESNQIGAGLGISVGTAGDVNSDGYADVIIGADTYDNDQINEGRVFVYHGSGNGPLLWQPKPAMTIQPASSTQLYLPLILKYP
jgi:hypothetical protein